ncbi:hypothetical protein Salat_2709400 [Sesamum alatum]|uniref:Uncharacterized protein n=1 Tax=Sesamum alatum TaxID=300844 RepID=A0AAE1XQ55_9LAMI|nr:hypothetical protein Salat_2709400 [Sesamum alatum]
MGHVLADQLAQIFSVQHVPKLAKYLGLPNIVGCGCGLWGSSYLTSLFHGGSVDMLSGIRTSSPASSSHIAALAQILGVQQVPKLAKYLGLPNIESNHLQGSLMSILHEHTITTMPNFPSYHQSKKIFPSFKLFMQMAEPRLSRVSLSPGGMPR